MGYDAAVLRRATARLEVERNDRERKRDELRRRLYAQTPELEGIDRQLRGTILDIISASLRQGSDPAPSLQVIKDRNMDLQHRRARLLE